LDLALSFLLLRLSFLILFLRHFSRMLVGVSGGVRLVRRLGAARRGTVSDCASKSGCPKPTPKTQLSWKDIEDPSCCVVVESGQALLT
jgi:hypothetical protein